MTVTAQEPCVHRHSTAIAGRPAPRLGRAEPSGEFFGKDAHSVGSLMLEHMIRRLIHQASLKSMSA